MTTETNKSNEHFYLINDGAIGIDIVDDENYVLHLWGKGLSLWMDKDEMYEFMEVMTNEENQKKMKDEMGKIRLINDVEGQIKEHLTNGSN